MLSLLFPCSGITNGVQLDYYRVALYFCNPCPIDYSGGCGAQIKALRMVILLYILLTVAVVVAKTNKL